MRKPNCASDSQRRWIGRPAAAGLLFASWLLAGSLLAGAGCATPEYAVRSAPTPDESQSVIQIEQAISAQQAREFTRQGARPIGPDERLAGFEIQRIVDRLSAVTERRSLHYQAYLYEDRDPNAAALADGRVYMSTGMLQYLSSRGGRQDELAFILGHELGHTVDQHLVKRFRMLQQQQLIAALIAAGASAVTRGAGPSAQQAGQLAINIGSLIQQVHASGYSQEQELEADQLGIQYVIRAGFNPQAALELLTDFSRFDSPSPFLRTHPYMALRREYLQRYLTETGHRSGPSAQAARPASFASSSSSDQTSHRIQQLRDTQKLYPKDSVSWHNLQREIDRLQHLFR